MDFNNNSYEEFMSIKTKPPVSAEGFDSQWDFLKATSYYHFDPQIEDQRIGTCENPLYIPLTRFQGDWTDDLQRLMSEASPATIGAKTIVPDSTNYDKKRSYFENKDLWTWGYNRDQPYQPLIRTRHAVGVLQKIADMFAFENLWIKCDIQLPNNAFYFHVDNFGMTFDQERGNNYERFAEIDYDQRRRMRLIVFLTDQDFGHVWHQGNLSLRWRRGDCFTYPWRDIPHGTANFGHTPRVTLNITGNVTERTHEILRGLPKIINVDEL